MKFILSVSYILLAIVILLLMVVIHEFGHYVAGKLLKFKINEFSVGFGPKLISKKKANGEVFSLRLFPLGGFCAFEGDETDEVETVNDKNEKVVKINEKAFVNEKPYKRIIVFFSGALFNFISAIIFSFIFILAIGYASPSVMEVYSDEFSNPYNQLLAGDEILEVNGKKVSVLNSFESLTQNFKLGDSVIFTVLRSGEEKEIAVVKKEIKSESGDYVGFGIMTMREYRKVSFGKALGSSVPFTFKMSWTILGTFGKLITGKIPLSSISGPIGTVAQIADLAHENWRNILILLPLIASNLAVFNLLPVPALDGSKIIFTSVEWIRKKPVNRNVENMIHFIGIIAILGLVLLIDIIGFFT